MKDVYDRKLEAVLPDAHAVERPEQKPLERWAVWGRNPVDPRRRLDLLTVGPTKSEAVDRAVFLFSRRP